MIYTDADDNYRSLQQHFDGALHGVIASESLHYLIEKQLPLLEAFFSDSDDIYERSKRFIRDYIRHSLEYFCALSTLSEMDNIHAYTRPYLGTAIDFFLVNTPKEDTDDSTTASVAITDLLSQAYSFYRMIEELNDRVALERQLPLAPIDLAYTNLIAHTIIGDDEANQLDQNVLIKLELTSAALADKTEAIFQNPATLALTEQRREAGWQDAYDKWPCLLNDISQ